MYLPGELITGGIENCIQLEVGLINSNKVFTVVNGELTSSDVQVLFETYETALVSGVKEREVVMTDQFQCLCRHEGKSFDKLIVRHEERN